MIHVFIVGECLVSQGVAQGKERITVGGSKVWSVQLGDEHFIALLKQLLSGDVCNQGPGVVEEEADGAVVRALVMNLSAQTTHF